MGKKKTSLITKAHKKISPLKKKKENKSPLNAAVTKEKAKRSGYIKHELQHAETRNQGVQAVAIFS